MKKHIIFLIILFFWLIFRPYLSVAAQINKALQINTTNKKQIFITPRTDLNNEQVFIFYDADTSHIVSQLQMYRLVYGVGQIGHGVFYYVLNKEKP